MYNSTPTKGLNGPIFLTWPMKINLSWSLWKFYDSADSLTKFAENADSLSGSNHKEIEFSGKSFHYRILLAFHLHIWKEKEKTVVFRMSIRVYKYSCAWNPFIQNIKSIMSDHKEAVVRPSIWNICHLYFEERYARFKYFINNHK